VEVSALHTLFHSKLSSLYDKREIDSIFFIYIEDKFAMLKHQFFLEHKKSIDEFITGSGLSKRKIYNDLKKIKKGVPIQHVTGKSFFYNLMLEVNPSVLIPRPETEELVAAIVKEESNGGDTSGLKILDIGTGSGAIAIALSKNIPNSKVWATDISKKAIKVAQRNATCCGAPVSFICNDILNDSTEFLPKYLDIIVANPPYIPQSDRSFLHSNVVDYEPSVALFVPDETPLLYYEAIAVVAQKNLRKGGNLYFETYEKFQREIGAMLAEKSFKEIKYWNDLNGKPRFISCKKL